MKRVLSFSMVLLIIINLLNINVFASDIVSYKVWTVPNSVKILKDQPIAPNAKNILEIEAAKNEYEGGQIIITAGKNPIDSINVSVSDFLCGENVISSDNVDVYVQHYMNITEPTTEMFAKGWYPDALIPIDKYISKHGKISIEAEKNQGVWFTFKIAKDVPAGLYTGAITINIDGRDEIVPATLKIWNFTLTDESHSESAFLNQSYFLLTGHPELEGKSVSDQEFWDLMAKYYDFLLDYRVTSTYLPVPSGNIDEFVELAEPYINDPRVTAYNIPYNTGDFDNGRAAEMVSKLKEKGLLDKAYYYLAAEIDEPTPDKFPLVRDFSEKIKALDSNLRHIVTTNVNSELFGYVNTFCSIFEPFHSESYLDMVKQRQGAGDDIWWYGCVWPKYPYPTYHIDDYLLGARLVSWMQKSYGIKGNLYWSTNLYLKYNYDEEKYEKRDVWNDPKGFPGANGDGFLLYPGYDYGIYGPIPTIRLETIRDGNEDFEYLWLLEQKVNAASAKLGVTVNADNILKQIYERLFTNIKSYNKNPVNLIETRREVAEMIEALDKEPTAILVIGEGVENETGREVQIFAEKGSVVRVNGLEASLKNYLENADEFTATVSYKAGKNDIVVECEKDSVVNTYTRKFFVNKNAPKIIPITINNFETEDDIALFTGDGGITLALSDQYVTEGSHSMEAVIPPANWFPGFFSAIDPAIKNFNDCASVEVDVYNKSNISIPFYMKFSNEKGQNFDINVGDLAPNQQTHISFSTKNFLADFDKSCVNKVLFWVWGNFGVDASLYLDNFYINGIVRDIADLTYINKVNNGIVVDGKIDDSIWNFTRELAVKTGETDNTAKFDLMWNDNYLYLAFDVTDENVLNTGSQQPWDDDSVEIYVDGDLSKGEYNEYTSRFIMRYGDDKVYAYGVQNIHTDKIYHKSLKTDTGYSMEVRIPWKALNTGGETGKAIGITVHVNDKDIDDASAQAGGKLSYTVNSSYDWESSADWANFGLSDNVVNNLVIVSDVSESDITIDGILDEEAWNINQSIEYIAWPSPNNTAKFGTLWNEKYLYVGFDVIDDDVQDPIADATPWDDDAVEIFIDGNLTKGEYDSHTGQFIIRYNDDRVYVYGNENFKTEGIIQKSSKTDMGYSIEIAIPWENVGIEAVDGKTIGLTTHVDDIDRIGGDKYGVLAYTHQKSVADPVSSANWAEFKLKAGEKPVPEDPTDPVIPVTPPQAPAEKEDDVIVEDEMAKVNLKAVLQSDKKTASVTVTDELLEKMFKLTKVNADGTKRVIINIDMTEGASNYTIKFNEGTFSGKDGSKSIEIRMPDADIIIPMNMLSGLDNAVRGDVTITAVIADTSEIPETVQGKIGDRPVIDIGLSVGDENVKWENAKTPLTVSLKYQPGKNELKKHEHIVVWYIDEEGNVKAIPNGKYAPGTREVIFKASHVGKYAVVYYEKTFEDLSKHGWAKNAVEAMASKGIISGTSETSYMPGANINRADFVSLLIRLLELEADFEGNFDDVKPGAYYYNTVGVAKKLGIISGVGENKFQPDTPITRQDMMIMVANALAIAEKGDMKGTIEDISNYSDAQRVSSYAVESVAGLIRNGIIEGDGRTINPEGRTTRAESAVVMYKLYEFIN